MEELNLKKDTNDLERQDIEKTGLEHRKKTILEQFEERRNGLNISNSLENDSSRLQKAEDREKIRQHELTELRERLVISQPEDNESTKDLDQSNKERRDEAFEKKDNEDISNSIKNLSQNVEELYKSIRRNNFQKIGFSPEGLLSIAKKEELNQDDTIRELQHLTSFINKIAPPDPRDQILEPRNFRSIIEEMENVYAKLSKLKSVFERSNSNDYLNLLKEVSRTQRSLNVRKDELLGSLSSLQRYQRR